MGNADVAVKFKRNPRSKESIREENELIILTAAEKVFAKHGLKGSTTKQLQIWQNSQNPIFIIIFILN
jgi:predicted Ser/Thr protein kinase